MRVISVYPNFANKGGAQNVVLQLAEKLNEAAEDRIVLTSTPVEQIEPDYRPCGTFLKLGWRSVRNLASEETVFLSHHRKCTSLLLMYKKLFFPRMHIVHVAHNTFDNLRSFCLYPQKVVAVSCAVKSNLVDYFRLSESRVTVIYNGLPDERNRENVKPHPGEVHVLLAGRICAVKQQLEIVRQAKGKLLPHVHLFFAGVGADAAALQELIKGETQFHYLGQIDMRKSLNQFDYVCLFSLKEGLPLSLIEGCMFGKPMVTNDLPVMLEVNVANETGFVFPDMLSLIGGLNDLPTVESEEYVRLSRNARARYELLFTEDRMIAQYRRLVEAELAC